MTSKLSKTRSKASSSSIISASLVGSDSEVISESEVEVEGASSGDEAATKYGSETLTPDDSFFFAFVTFRVEDKLFRVPRYALEDQSEFFRKLFILKIQTSSKKVTKDVNEPIFLEEVEKDAFRNLLHLLYPSPVLTYPVNKLSLSLGQWVKLLHFSRLWDLTTIRNLVIQELEAIKLEEVEKLELALKYEITQWYADAYLALAKRPKPLNVEEGKRLGLELSVKIAQVRERRLARMIEPELKGTKAATIGNSTGAFAPYSGTYLPFSSAIANGPTSSTATGASCTGNSTTLDDALFSQNGSSCIPALPASSPPPLFGTAGFGFSMTSSGQPETEKSNSDTFTFNFGQAASNKKLPRQARRLSTALKKLGVDWDDAQLKQDIKEVFEL